MYVLRERYCLKVRRQASKNCYFTRIYASMTLMKIPNWLSKRRVCCDDPSELQKLLPRKKNFHFSDITVAAMQNFYHHNTRSVFYKLIRILGFYGVKFDGKLASFSGPLDIVGHLINFQMCFVSR